ncbi:Pkinase-domain-containing protein [Exidia glandulosa HHB12029]|uniref:Pkinase-domain-containing protein n=1 Tax=Exidia glandulosa HHB12029 TaxID=1314781 RepID=A0A165E1V9_EXIGL|nr:Pkinase-domain-containing protein [Exidia glandulosa HHB12029]
MLQYPHSHLVVPLRNVKQVPPLQPQLAVAPQRLPTPPLSPLPVTASKPASTSQRSTHSVNDLLAAGDIIGDGLVLNGEPITRVDLPTPDHIRNHGDDEPGQHFEVVRKLGSGSYAVVYLVREYFGPLDSHSSEDVFAAGDIELDGAPAEAQRPSSPRYGREFAIKCLSKENLTQESLQAQLVEATVHQSLPVHPNIVTLYRTLETASLLLLVLESVPGEDLFYFLEQARDQHVDDTHAPFDLSVTPPTPSLLSSFQASQLLSYGRLRLIASMFAQMCEAVAHCHNNGVAHRDIKPENFIVTDAWTDGPDGRRERRVVVKLTDFGLATTDVESADMECGSAPYMSYECRNNLAPTYYPRPADVWSLGIVLINMVYHRNPWSDTSIGACEAFELFRENAQEFFMKGFYGMTRDVAEYLSESVFCILEQPDDTRRVSAQDFGVWVKNLPQLMGARPRAPAMTVDTDNPQQKRQRKRGQRKNRTTSALSSNTSLPSPEDDRLETLASRNQDLVRELSRLSTRSSVNSLQSSLRSQALQPPPPVPSLPSPQRKTSRWKGVFSLKQQSAAASAPSVVDREPEVVLVEEEPPRQMSATVSNVSSLIMGLSAPPGSQDQDRGRRRDREEVDPGLLSPRSPDWSEARGSDPDSSRRNVSPLSTRSRGGASTLGPSFQSANWRNSMSSSASSIHTGSAYTRFSNASVRSVSTAATSLSGSSWRTGPSAQVQLDKAGKPLRRPSNVKEMNGVPWELHELPRYAHMDPRAHVFDSPPAPKPPRAARRQDGARGLSTIAEGRNGSGNASGVGSPPKLSVYTQTDAATSTTGLSPPQSPTTAGADGGPKKVNKGQINTLAKLLSTLKSR